MRPHREYTGQALGSDAWLTRSESPGNAGIDCGITYRCLDCDWTGRGGASVVEHHSAQHHRMRIRNGPELAFRCCNNRGETA